MSTFLLHKKDEHNKNNVNDVAAAAATLKIMTWDITWMWKAVGDVWIQNHFGAITSVANSRFFSRPGHPNWLQCNSSSGIFKRRTCLYTKFKHPILWIPHAVHHCYHLYEAIQSSVKIENIVIEIKGFIFCHQPFVIWCSDDSNLPMF